ncbi:cell division protein FtsA [Bacteroidia bacterium]|nr:cell division protein FtsA [Bacteroidia bacterium]
MEKFIAALDLGSSKIIAMIARKNSDGVLSILHVEKIDSETAIRRGSVHNLDGVSRKISDVIRRLNNQLATGQPNQTIEQVYVGIGGQALHSEQQMLKKEVEDGIVSTKLIDTIDEEVLRNNPKSALIRESFLPEYYLNGELDPDPVGAASSTIEARYQLIMGRPLSDLKKAIEEKARVEVADIFVTPLATAEAVLTDKEKELGCALVEFGAGLTYVSVYKDNLLKHLATIPLGGAVITKDICSLDISQKDAEEFKINYGSALAVEEDEAEDDSEQSEEKYELKLKKVVEARVAEILANVIEQISLSGYAQSIGKIVITGGGASLKDLPETIKNKTGKEVRLANARKSLVNQAAEWSQQPANAAVIGLLALGTVNCLKKKEVALPSQQRQQQIFTPEEVETKNSLNESREEKEKREKERKAREKAEKEERERKEKERRAKEKAEKEAQKGPNLFERIFNQFEIAAGALLNPDEENTEDKNNPENKNNNKQ